MTMGSSLSSAGTGLVAAAGWASGLAALPVLNLVAAPVLGLFANGSVLCFREPILSSLRLALDGLIRLLLFTPASAAGRFLRAFSLPFFDPAAQARILRSHDERLQGLYQGAHG